MELLSVVAVGFVAGAVIGRWWAPFVVGILVGMSFWLFGEQPLPGAKTGLAEAYGVLSGMAAGFGSGIRRGAERL